MTSGHFTHPRRARSHLHQNCNRIDASLPALCNIAYTPATASDGDARGEERDVAGQKETFALVVNGENAAVELNVNEALHNLVKAGLKETDNEKGHPLEDWEIRAV